MRRVAGLLLAATISCAGPDRALARDEIEARDLRLPEGAKPGMFITWRRKRRPEDPDDVVEESVACVAGAGERVVVEWRTRTRAGLREVVAARFSPDGTPEGAWKGAPGTVGRPLRIVAGEEPDLEEARREADARGRPLGISTGSAKTSRSSLRKTLETPAGRIPCVGESIRVSVLLTSGTCTAWHAETALPLSRLVKFEMTGPFDSYESLVLEAYGWKGAAPTLRLP